jgi:hypothetical protein
MDMNYNIKCMSWQGDETDVNAVPERRDWEINTDGKVWPCCKFISQIYSYNGLEKLGDDRLKTLIETDPDWNNLYERDISDIVNHWAYSEYIHPRGWNSETPPEPCARLCGNKQRKSTDLNPAENFNRLTKDK